MKQQVYNLKEFAEKYLLADTFGAYAAYFTVNEDESQNPESNQKELDCFKQMVKERTLFTKLLLVKKGESKMNISGNENVKTIMTHDLLVLSAKHVIEPKNFSPDFKAECILVDAKFENDNTIFHLADDKYKTVSDTFHFVQNIVQHQHINKVEMIESMFNVLRLLLEEIPYEKCTISHDLKHKKEVYEIFLHHLYRNFKKERQIRFYADKLNVSQAYLSRLVKEISGSTVNDHVTSLVYKEICNKLSLTDLPMGEIADQLNFSDQSALTNFFKQRSGMTPLAYRTKKMGSTK